MAADLLPLLPLILALLVPVALFAASLLLARRSPFRTASLVTFVTAGLSILAVTLHGVFSLLGYAPRGQRVGSTIYDQIQLDLVSSAMLVLVCALGIVVVRYSRTYLAGESGLERYERSLLLTLASVTLLVISNHFAVLIGAWITTELFLHQLLTFYRSRRQAVIVAHKKFLLNRVADMAFVGSLALLSTEVGSLRIDEVNAFAQSRVTLSPPLHLATVLLVFGVLLKTAQLPFHGWMLQVMEAPTPVSALLHAGVVNIGGFVMIRLSPLMAHAGIAQGMLVGVGLFTAILGSLVMTTRVTIKVALAWSTIAQMGFMLVQCGLGVWHLALLHLLAHSFYKAHAFLSSGSVVETWRGASLVRASRPSLAFTAAGVVVLCIAASPLYAGFKASSLHASPSLGPLALALLLSFVPMLGRALAAGRRAFARAALFTLGATAAYFAGHALFEGIAPSIAPSIAADATSSLEWSIVLGALVLLFIIQTVLQTSPSGRFTGFVQPHLLRGLYMDDWFTRATFRVWPPRLERHTAATPSSRARSKLYSRSE
ncbi:MAG: dehydrogenase, subunit 5 [Myxococcaceae bacterium]|jgi:NAD(P)H-quinone oxidoreductase subunit 5|nr:dehydrogenase, subunit 5 [Myxococcaceae bacterium]